MALPVSIASMDGGMVTLVQGDGRSTTAPVKRDATWTVRTVSSPEEITAITSAWDDLAWNALEPNPFYESWYLLPAWQLFGARDDVRLVLVERSGVRPQDPPELCGLIPLWRRKQEKLPVTCWALWQNDYICNCTPLLRQGLGTETWRAFMDWLTRQTPALLELPLVNADGPFQHALLEVVNERHSPLLVDYQYSRALLRPAESVESYCAQTMTNHNRQELRRQRRRLGEQGQLEVRVTRPEEDITPWIDEFLRLEAAGWKGAEGTAFAARETDADFLRTIISSAARRNQVVLLGLFLDGQAIALKLNLLSGNGGFTFKIAFDETFRKFSPGVQLELENLDWFHGQYGLEWLDSCARPDHFMIGRLWKDRRIMQRLLLSTGSRMGDLLVGGLALAKSVRAAIRPRQPVEPQPVATTKSTDSRSP